MYVIAVTNVTAVTTVTAITAVITVNTVTATMFVTDVTTVTAITLLLKPPFSSLASLYTSKKSYSFPPVSHCNTSNGNIDCGRRGPAKQVWKILHQLLHERVRGGRGWQGGAVLGASFFSGLKNIKLLTGWHTAREAIQSS